MTRSAIRSQRAPSNGNSSEKVAAEPLLDRRAHQPACPVKPRLDRLGLERQLTCGLLDAHLLDVAQDEHGPERIREIIDGLLEELADLPAGKLAIGGRRRQRSET